MSPKHPGPCAKPKTGDGKKARPGGGGGGGGGEVSATTASDPRVIPAREANSWGREHFDSREELSTDELRAVEGYAGTGAITNKYLRTGQVGPSSRKSVESEVAGLDSVMRRSRVPEDVTVTRATGLDAFGGDPSAHVGKVLVDHGFLSTSVGDQVRGAGSIRRQPVQMTITVPKGTRGYYTNNVKPTFSEEKELLLDRGQRIQITSATRTRSGKWKITAQIVQ